MIRILIAEDSLVQRDVLIYLLEAAGGFEILGIARDGAEAVAETARLRPDIVLMDCHLPRLDGLEATRRIMEQSPTPIVVVSATQIAEEVSFAFNAVRAGALAALVKPTALEGAENRRLAQELIHILRLMSEVKVVRLWPADRKKPAELPERRVRQAVGADVKVIAMAGSTGAPGIIADILGGLDHTIGVPLLIVQHLASGFAEGFALWLRQKSGIPVQMAAANMKACPGHAYVAPDNRQMGIDANLRIVLSDAPPEEGFQPSASFLLRSVAQSCGRGGLGILLTGMGRDGASGLLEIRRAGGITLIQDEPSCVVFGMPGEALRIGAAQHVLPPAGIIRFVLENVPLAPGNTEGPKKTSKDSSGSP